MNPGVELQAASNLAASSSEMPWRPYGEYRCSSIEGIRQLPRHWEEKPLKYGVRINPDQLDETTDPEYEMDYVDIGSVSLLEGITRTESYTFEKAPSRARRIVRNGDTIVSTVRTYLKAVARIVDPPPNLVASTGFAVLRPTPALDPGYLYRLVQSPTFVDRVVAHSVGVSYPAINPTELGSLAIQIPSIDEQRAIAAFLDRETARIDALVKKKERLIELLEEKRAALISRAVTKGLNPDAPMKDSGSPWVPAAPKHWQETKLGYLCRFISGSTPSKDKPEFWNGSIPWVSPKDMKTFELGDSEDHITDEAIAAAKLWLIQPEAVVIVVRGMILAHSFPVGLTTRPVTINQDMKALIPKANCMPRFLADLLRGLKDAMLAYVEESAHGTKCLRTDVWRGLEIRLPPLSEQEEICAWIARQSARIDQLVSTVDCAITRLREYRTALISAAVTGKIDVRRLA